MDELDRKQMEQVMSEMVKTIGWRSVEKYIHAKIEYAQAKLLNSTFKSLDEVIAYQTQIKSLQGVLQHVNGFLK